MVLCGVIEDRFKVAVAKGLRVRSHSPVIGGEDIRGSTRPPEPHLGILGRESVSHITQHRIVEAIPNEQNGKIGKEAGDEARCPCVS